MNTQRKSRPATAPPVPPSPHVVVSGEKNAYHCKNCDATLAPAFPANVEDFVAESERFIKLHAACATRPAPDRPPVLHVLVTSKRRAVECRHCGEVAQTSAPDWSEDFRLFVVQFAARHAVCTPPADMRGVPEYGKHFTATVWQILFKGAGDEYHLWKTIYQKVGFVHIWGHESRDAALQWLAALPDTEDAREVIVRPVFVRASFTAPPGVLTAEHLTVGEAAALVTGDPSSGPQTAPVAPEEPAQ